MYNFERILYFCSTSMEKYYDNNIILSLSNGSIGYNEKHCTKIVANELNLQAQKGEFICLLGPNGCGKSTLLRTIAGMQPTLSGEIFIENTSLQNIPIDALAKKMSIVLTDSISIPNMSVYDIVSLGRYPHTNWFGTTTCKDEQVVQQSIDLVGMHDFVRHDFIQLSDGEKQRIMIAKALAQETPIILLDEPTAHLDIPNRISILKLLQRLAKETNKTIILSTHELNLALQYADTIWLMQKNKPIICDTPQALIASKTIEKVFDVLEYN